MSHMLSEMAEKKEKRESLLSSFLSSRRKDDVKESTSFSSSDDFSFDTENRSGSGRKDSRSIPGIVSLFILR